MRVSGSDTRQHYSHTIVLLRLLLNMYEKQKLQVEWGNHGVKQGDMLSPVLFALGPIIEKLFERLAIVAM